MIPLWVAFVSFANADANAPPPTTTAEPTHDAPDEKVLVDEFDDFDGDFLSMSGRKLQNGTWIATDGATFEKIPDSEGMSCSNEAEIFLHETFENTPMNSSSAVMLCADECTQYVNPNMPTSKCKGFELRDIAGTVGLPGVQCKLFSGKCALAPGMNDIRGQYYMTEGAPSKFPVVPAVAAGVIGMSVAGYFLMKPSYTVQQYEYSEAAEAGLLEDPSSEILYDEGEYDSEFMEEEEYLEDE
jgi:hypothetical protein